MYERIKAGYQGKRDAMRELANRLMGNPGTGPDVIESKSAADKEKMRPFKTGGSIKNNLSEVKEIKQLLEGGEVKKMCGGSMKSKAKKSNKMQKYAMGGVAKIRHEEATNQGLPKTFKKKPIKNLSK